ncbi:MFS transporter [Corynebacterium sp. AOP40-9SA-29]|uniref:MFS transporter n=1 Tax=Corynebacterium sp. AOP40-9SA-29 TaxID=3457677 RepID=UPI00403425CA
MSMNIARRRVALLALFFLPGMGIASWVTRTPAIRDAIDASTAQMGMVLFGLSIGSMLGILSSGPLVARLGARTVIGVGLVGVVVSMPTIGIGAAAGSPFVVFCGLAFFGAGMGAGEVAMNIEGADVEKVARRPFLPLLHGFFSLGTVAGALLGMLATAVDFSVIAHLILIGVLAAVVLLVAIRELPAHTGRIGPDDREVEGADSAGRPAVWKDPTLILISVIVLAMALAEGTANDWLPLVMVDEHGFADTLGSAIYTVFAASMAVGRLVGGPIVQRWGRAPVLFVSALLGALGIALISLVDNQAVAAGSVVLWGLGASLGFPVALSAAGESGAQQGKRVAFASTVGYLSFLVGPPALGFIGESAGLRTALILPLVVLLIAALLVPALRPGGRKAGTRSDRTLEKI